MTEIQRVKKICKWLNFNDYADNDAELANLLGYTKSSFSQIINEKVLLSNKFIDKLCDVDKNINKVWVFEGVGDMFSGVNNILNEPLEVYATDYKEKYFDAKYTVEIQKKYIENLENQIKSLELKENKSKAG